MRADHPHDTADLLAEGFATVRDAMKFLAIGKSLIYELMERGELPYATFGRCRRIPWAGLRAYAAAQLKGVARAVPERNGTAAIVDK